MGLSVSDAFRLMMEPKAAGSFFNQNGRDLLADLLHMQQRNRVRKNARRLSFRSAGFARESGIHEHEVVKSMAWPVFLDSGPGPEGPSRNDGRAFPHSAKPRKTIHG